MKPDSVRTDPVTGKKVYTKDPTNYNKGINFPIESPPGWSEILREQKKYANRTTSAMTFQSSMSLLTAAGATLVTLY